MVQAAVEGVIDFSKARFSDYRWHRYVGQLLRGLQRRNNRELLFVQRDELLALVSGGNIEPDRVEDFNKRLSVMYFDIYETYYPHEHNKRQVVEQTMAQRDVDSWEEAFGDLSDKEVEANLQTFVDTWAAENKKG